MADINTSLNAISNGNYELHAFFFANEQSVPVMSLYDESADRYGVSPYTYPDNVQAANEAFNTYGYYKLTLKVKLAEPGNIKIGIENNNSVYSDWCCFDNFKLTYLDATTAGIKGVEADASSSADSQKGKQGIYRLDGMKLNAKPAQGIYIQGGKKLR